MDKVVCALKNRILGHDMDDDFFLMTVGKYLTHPSSFRVEEGLCFKDIIINEYCKQIINKHAKKLQSQLRTKQVKEKGLMQLESNHKKHKEKDSYLNISFSEDVR
jgi:hypothetical protein